MTPLTGERFKSSPPSHSNHFCDIQIMENLHFDAMFRCRKISLKRRTRRRSPSSSRWDVGADGSLLYRSSPTSIRPGRLLVCCLLTEERSAPCSVEFVRSCPDPDLWLPTEYDAEQPLMVLRGPPGGGMLTLYRPWREGGGGGREGGGCGVFLPASSSPSNIKTFLPLHILTVLLCELRVPLCLALGDLFSLWLSHLASVAFLTAA